MGTKYYCVFDADKRLVTRLISDVHDIPVGAVEVERTIWLQTSQETDGIWTLGSDGSIEKLAPSPEPIDYVALIASTRYEHEVSGISLNGMAIDTGRDSQGLITGAALQAMLSPGYTLRWKTRAGFVDLTSAQIIEVASAVRAHVQACFDREADLLAALSEGAFTIDMLNRGWPV